MFFNGCTRQLASSCTRTFSTTSRQSWKSNKNALLELHANLPPYPHGPSLWYKQSNKGLYGGQTIQVGNNVSPKTEIKTRRKWYPNIMRKALFSKALNRRIRVRVSTRVLRTIDKVGGLDEYLLGEKSARIKELGMEGWRLRCMVMGTQTVQKRFNEQRRKLGLPEVDYRLLAQEIAAPPVEFFYPEQVQQEMAEFVVDEVEDEVVAGEEALAAQSIGDETGVRQHEISREQMFVEKAEEARHQNWGKEGPR